MRAGLDASTVTPGRTAPDVSLTVPVIDACANAKVGNSTANAAAGTIRTNECILMTSCSLHTSPKTLVEPNH
jgi:hypothetical protein